MSLNLSWQLMAASEFGKRNTKARIHPVLYQEEQMGGGGVMHGGYFSWSNPIIARSRVTIIFAILHSDIFHLSDPDFPLLLGDLWPCRLIYWMLPYALSPFSGKSYTEHGALWKKIWPQCIKPFLVHLIHARKAKWSRVVCGSGWFPEEPWLKVSWSWSSSWAGVRQAKKKKKPPLQQEEGGAGLDKIS